MFYLEREDVDEFPERHWSNIQALNDCNLLTYILLVTVLPFLSPALYVGLVRILFVLLWLACQMLGQLLELPSSAVQVVSAVVLASIRRDSSLPLKFVIECLSLNKYFFLVLLWE